MRKNFAALAAAILAGGACLAQQLPVPEPGATASPAPPPLAAPTAAPAPKEPAKPANVLDSLSLPDAQQAVELLKSNYLDPGALNDTAIARATVQGLLDRLNPGVLLLPAGAAAAEEPNPLRAEILDDRVGYLRLGTISAANVNELDAALKGFSDKALKSAILDLRATPAGGDFAIAAQVIERFAPKGKTLFTIKRPSDKQERVFTAGENLGFRGLLIVLTDKDTAGASEVIAAVLRIRVNALIVGQRTRGQAVEFDDYPLHGGQILRIGAGEVVLPEEHSIYPDGVKPDLAVNVPEAPEKEVLRQEFAGGVSKYVFETERPRMNEASLVAGTNPEIDAMEAAQRTKERAKPPLRDVILQRGMDAITSISLYENAK